MRIFARLISDEESVESFERGAADDPCGSGSLWLVALDDARPADRLRVWLIPIVANGQNRLTWIRAQLAGQGATRIRADGLGGSELGR